MPGWNSVFADYKARIVDSEALYERKTVRLSLVSTCPDVWDETEVVRVHSVRKSFERLVSVFSTEHVNQLCGGHFDGYWWIGVGIDKGGDTVKVTGTVINTGAANNPHFSIILGIYRGEESYNQLRLCLKDLLEECETVTELTVRDGRAIPAKAFLSVDGKVLTTMYGMGTGSSRYSCARCTWDKGNDSDLPFQSRDCAHFRAQQLIYLDALMDSDDKRSRTAHWESLGVERELLCTIETDRVFPATLHYLLGPGVRLIKKLEGLCLTKDLCEHGFGYEMDSFDEKVRNGLIERRGLEIDKVRQALRDERRYERDVEGMISAIGTGRRTHNDRCIFMNCFIKDRTFSSDWAEAVTFIKCQMCDMAVHAICTCVALNEVELAKESSSYLCMNCNYESDATILSRLTKKQQAAKSHMKKLENMLFMMNSTLPRFESICNGYGENYRALCQALSSCGARRSRYFQTFTGGQVLKVLKSLDRIYDRVGLEKKGIIYDSLCAFRDINKSFSPEFLSEKKICELESSIDTFKKLYVDVVETAYESSKFHEIITHVIEFARKWKTVGLFSEQATH